MGDKHDPVNQDLGPGYIEVADDGTFYPTILPREDIPMQVIKGASGLAVPRLMARAQLNRIKGRLAGKKGAPYLTDPFVRTPTLSALKRMAVRPTGVATVNPWDNVVLRNQAGQIMDYNWLFDMFGPITLDLADPVECVDGKFRVMRLIEAQESIGPAVLVIKILHESGQPWDGCCVARGWPGAPKLPGTPLETIRWSEEAVYGFTNVEGDIGYGLGGGDYYWRYDTQAGCSYIFTLGVLDKGIYTPDGGLPSDFPRGMGMLGGTEHQGLLRYTYQWIEVEGEDPEPEPEDEEVIELLKEIRDLIAAGGGSFPAELDFTGKIVLPA